MSVVNIMQGDGHSQEFVSLDRVQALSSANAAICQNANKVPKHTLASLTPKTRE